MIGTGDNNHGPPVTTLVRKMVATGLGALHNRGELLMIELQEEKSRAISLLVRALSLLFLGVLSVMLLTAAVIFLFPEEQRVAVTLGLGVLYLVAAGVVALTIRSSLKHPAFSETLAQMKKDREWLQSRQ
jgi:uncharacterized membrane protein YqjE